MDNEKGFTAIMVKVSTQEMVKAGAAAREMTMYELVSEAVTVYLARHTRPDFRHVAADSDQIGGRDV